MQEDRIVFTEGQNGQLRSLRGKIVNEDALFLVLSRRNGIVRIAKSCVVKVYEGEGANEERKME